ncbi:MAG: efflux RND transporter periplasmic adaptor subunit [Planctomycetota bacterium]
MTRIWFFLLPALVLLASCQRTASVAKTDVAAERVIVTLAPTTMQSIERRVAVVGTIFGNQELTLSAKVSGRVRQVLADMGDRVAPGDALVQIEQTDYELERLKQDTALHQTLARLGLTSEPDAGFDENQLPTVQRAVLQAQNAEAKMNRARRLFEQKPPRMSEQEFADLRTEWQVMQSNAEVERLTVRALLAEARARRADLDVANQHLADTTVRAPASGGRTEYAVATRMVSGGEYVREGDPLLRLVDDHPVKYRATVPERFIADVKVEQSVAVTVEAYRQQFTGRVTRVRPQIDPASRTFEIEVLIDNQDHRLIPGAFARGSVLVGTDRDVTLVPQAAVVAFAGSKKVFTVEDGKAVAVAVETGRVVQDHVEVTRGLQGRRDVVVTGATKLADGSAVEVKRAAEIDAPPPPTPRSRSE